MKETNERDIDVEVYVIHLGDACKKKNSNETRLHTVCLAVSFLAMMYFIAVGLIDGLTVYEFILSCLLPMAAFVICFYIRLGLFPSDSGERNPEKQQRTQTLKKSLVAKWGFWLLGVCFGLALMIGVVWLLFALVS